MQCVAKFEIVETLERYFAQANLYFDSESPDFVG